MWPRAVVDEPGDGPTTTRIPTVPAVARLISRDPGQHSLWAKKGLTTARRIDDASLGHPSRSTEVVQLRRATCRRVARSAPRNSGRTCKGCRPDGFAYAPFRARLICRQPVVRARPHYGRLTRSTRAIHRYGAVGTDLGLATVGEIGPSGSTSPEHGASFHRRGIDRSRTSGLGSADSDRAHHASVFVVEDVAVVDGPPGEVAERDA